MFKAAFDVPNTKAGAHFLTWWDRAESGRRDQVMKLAYANDIPVTEALAQLADPAYEDNE
ncbi:MAG: hypothetical protein DRP01_03705 [Archaeoglobales archaeon]|nr:MAG: hypothetical protein DRP01_03705 [Archaeoglobales archaeon]